MYSPVAAEPTRGGSPGDSVVTLDQVPRWSDAEQRLSLEPDSEDTGFSSHHFPDLLASASTSESGSNGIVPRFPVDHEINSRLYLWRGHPWNIEVDAVNSTSENLDEAHSSPGLHAAAGSGLAEECATLAHLVLCLTLIRVHVGWGQRDEVEQVVAVSAWLMPKGGARGLLDEYGLIRW